MINADNRNSIPSVVAFTVGLCVCKASTCTPTPFIRPKIPKWCRNRTKKEEKGAAELLRKVMEKICRLRPAKIGALNVKVLNTGKRNVAH